MPKIFCPNCYHGNEYSSKPGRFCSECGQSFTESSSSLPSQNKIVTKPVLAPVQTLQPLPNRLTKLKTRRAQIEEEYDENDNIEENTDQDDIIVPEIDELEVEIQNNLRPNTNSFKDIAATIKPGERKKRGRPMGKNLSKKQIEEDFKSRILKNNSLDIK